MPRNLLDALSESGSDIDDLAHSVGLSRAKLEQGVTAVECDRFLTVAWQAVDNPAFGLDAGSNLKPELYGIAGLMGLTSPTLGEALHRLVRYTSLTWGDPCEFVQDSSAATIHVTSVGPERAYTRAKVDMQLASKLAFARRFAGEQVNPINVSLKCPRPNWADRYFDYYKCQIEFCSNNDSIMFSRRDLELPLRSANAQINPLLERHAEDALVALDRDCASSPVRVALQRALNGSEPQLASVAKALRMSARTLQRRLSMEGVRFADLLDDVRHRVAEQHIAAGRLSVMEIAFLLGYADAASFHRAFKRWTGTTPQNFQRERTATRI